MSTFLSSGNLKKTKKFQNSKKVQNGGRMVRFKELGFESFEEYINSFFSTLMPSNKTYEYFVDWRKVRRDVQKYVKELSLLNSLTKISSEKRKDHLKELLTEYPETAKVIPMLIAERAKDNKINIFDPELETFIVYDFSPTALDIGIVTKIVEFCEKTGILALFDDIKDLYDYLLGVEVGLDSNTRKNRSGEIFEKMCQQKIKTLTGQQFTVANNDPNFSLYKPITGNSKGKTHDIVLYKGNKPVLVVECNFYNVGGSKPISIAESYVEMQKAANERNVKFLWVTDGPAWSEMKENLLRAMEEIDYILNYKMLDLIQKIVKT